MPVVNAAAKTPHEPRLARVASLVADTSRSRMLSYLLGGEFASAGELARACGAVTVVPFHFSPRYTECEAELRNELRAPHEGR